MDKYTEELNNLVNQWNDLIDEICQNRIDVAVTSTGGYTTNFNAKINKIELTQKFSKSLEFKK